MKFSCILPFVLFSGAAAFAPATVRQRPHVSLRMGEEFATQPASVALVPIKEETVEFTAGIVGGAAGLVIGGPTLAVFAALASNFVSKGDTEASDIVSAVSKSAIQIYNYLQTLDSKYDLLVKAQGSLESSLEKLKEVDNVDPETVAKVENALTQTKDKIVEINDEYDLVGGGVTALGVVGDLVEKAIIKSGELNEEYKLTDKAKEALSSAISKAKVAIDERS